MISVNHHPLICENNYHTYHTYPRMCRHQVPTSYICRITLDFDILYYIFFRVCVFPLAVVVPAFGIITSVLFMCTQTSYHNINKTLQPEWNRKKSWYNIIFFHYGLYVSLRAFFHRWFQLKFSDRLRYIFSRNKLEFIPCFCFGKIIDKHSSEILPWPMVKHFCEREKIYSICLQTYFGGRKTRTGQFD